MEIWQVLNVLCLMLKLYHTGNWNRNSIYIELQSKSIQSHFLDVVQNAAVCISVTVDNMCNSLLDAIQLALRTGIS